MGLVTVQQMADRVSGLLDERLHVKGRTLDEQMRKVGRRLPRNVRDAGEALGAAVMMIGNPKLMAQVDDETVAMAYDICVRHLTTINPSAARKGLLLDLAARIAFALLVVAVLFLTVVYWRGLI
jgi:hypothetical protein